MSIIINGSLGEGGGQILRTALSLSMCTGQAFHINAIRGNRKKPGLMRQHLTAVQAAAQICHADVQGDWVGSQELFFKPEQIQGGQYSFSIGTAGSCILVLQTVLPALLMATEPSHLILEGGTHNPMSPPFHFLQRAFLPLLQRMGAAIEVSLERYGFYPAGGGRLQIHITPRGRLAEVHVPDRGMLIKAYAESVVAALPRHIAERELAHIQHELGWHDEQLQLLDIAPHQGPGNVVLLTLEHEHVTEVFTAFGEKGVSAEAVAAKVLNASRHYQTSCAAVDQYLADQLLLPMALAGGGSFTTTAWSLHASTNACIIKQYLPIKIEHKKMPNNLIQVTLTSGQLS
ncbi:MAG: RNA 3'-terminal phosphate cyclase [Methylococcaceae bacterium]|jgi:RNA 3'-terminal phosphate cyclase (ATP)|nr:MAG: RNA 3'-terminal phosphate cyclase [Methylococcaceae bacterium]